MNRGSERRRWREFDGHSVISLRLNIYCTASCNVGKQIHILNYSFTMYLYSFLYFQGFTRNIDTILV